MSSNSGWCIVHKIIVKVYNLFQRPVSIGPLGLDAELNTIPQRAEKKDGLGGASWPIVKKVSAFVE
jgi:hypothetical protein